MKLLNLPNNEITHLGKFTRASSSDLGCSPSGCEFLGKTVDETSLVKLQKLKLDYNNIRTAGLAVLTTGLCMNSFLERLSLNFCDIDSNGAMYLQNKSSGMWDSSLHTLKLRGNTLRNEGIY